MVGINIARFLGTIHIVAESFFDIGTLSIGRTPETVTELGIGVVKGVVPPMLSMGVEGVKSKPKLPFQRIRQCPCHRVTRERSAVGGTHKNSARRQWVNDRCTCQIEVSKRAVGAHGDFILNRSVVIDISRDNLFRHRPFRRSTRDCRRYAVGRSACI